MKKLAGFMVAAGLAFTVGCAQTDAGITTNVKSKFAADDTVKAYQIDVDTQNKVVTLSGNVESGEAKLRAVAIARETNGVADVIDRIAIGGTAATSGRFDQNDIDVTVDPDLKRDAERSGNAIKDAAEKTGDAIVDGTKRGAEAVKDGAQKTGAAIKDAVTDDDPDSNKDGK